MSEGKPAHPGNAKLGVDEPINLRVASQPGDTQPGDRHNRVTSMIGKSQRETEIPVDSAGGVLRACR